MLITNTTELKRPAGYPRYQLRVCLLVSGGLGEEDKYVLTKCKVYVHGNSWLKSTSSFRASIFNIIFVSCVVMNTYKFPTVMPQIIYCFSKYSQNTFKMLAIKVDEQ